MSNVKNEYTNSKGVSQHEHGQSGSIPYILIFGDSVWVSYKIQDTTKRPLLNSRDGVFWVLTFSFKSSNLTATKRETPL